MPNKYIGGSGGSKIWQKLQDSIAWMTGKISAKADQTDLAEMQTELSAQSESIAQKQDILTDADKQEITLTGMTSGDAWTSDNKASAREQICAAANMFELLASATITEDVTSIQIPFSRKVSEIIMYIHFGDKSADETITGNGRTQPILYNGSYGTSNAICCGGDGGAWIVRTGDQYVQWHFWIHNGQGTYLKMKGTPNYDHTSTIFAMPYPKNKYNSNNYADRIQITTSTNGYHFSNGDTIMIYGR